MTTQISNIKNTIITMKLNDGSELRIHYEYFKDRISQFSELKYLIEEVDKKKEFGQVFIDVYFLDYPKHSSIVSSL